jgi:hypothetical protein
MHWVLNEAAEQARLFVTSKEDLAVSKDEMAWSEHN